MRSRSVTLLAEGVMILLLGLQSMGVLIWHVQRGQVRHTIKQRIKAGVPEEERVTFRFSADQLRDLDWEEIDREFRLDGRMFDVVARRDLGKGTIELSCIDDKQETLLFAHLDAMTDRAMHDRTSVRPISLSPTFPPMEALHLSAPPTASVIANRTEDSVRPRSGHVSVPDPPPWG